MPSCRWWTWPCRGCGISRPAQFQQFRAAVQKLVESDGEIDLFEYVLQKIVLRHLEPHFLQARKPIIQYYAIKPLAGGLRRPAFGAGLPGPG